MRSLSHISSSSKLRRAGFTLVEVMIAVAIIGLISGVVIFEYWKFDSQLLLRNLAYEIALSIRQAQALGIGVQGGLSEDFTTSYGVRLDTGNTYLLFRDDGDTTGRYDEDDTVLQSFTIERRNTIGDLCVGSAPLSGGDCGRDSLDILFTRPEPDAEFFPSGSDAEIIVRSPKGNERRVVISNTGQISVQ